jgi:hypothetical protein
MCNLNDEEFDLDILSPSQIGLFSESPSFADSGNEVSIGESDSSSHILQIEKSSVSKSEISLIFDQYDSNNKDSNGTKAGIQHLYYFVCSLACAAIREGPKKRLVVMYGNAATHFGNVIQSFPDVYSNRIKFWAFVPEDWNQTWPQLFLDFVESEKVKTPSKGFTEKLKLPEEPDDVALKHFFFGFKVWKIAQENRTEINNHLNKRYVPASKLKSGKIYFLSLM